MTNHLPYEVILIIDYIIHTDIVPPISTHHRWFSLTCLSLSLTISSFSSSRVSLLLCSSVLACFSLSHSACTVSICSVSWRRSFSSCPFSLPVRSSWFLYRCLSLSLASWSRRLLSRRNNKVKLVSIAIKDVLWHYCYIWKFNQNSFDVRTLTQIRLLVCIPWVG